MGVVNTKASAITNADAIYPYVLSAPYLTKGALFCAAGKVATTATDSAGSLYKFIRIPSGARIHNMEIFSDAITGMSSNTVGLYDIQDRSSNQGAAVSAALFATGIDLSVAQTEPYDVIFNNLGISNIEKRVWELLGLSADPFKFYDVTIVSTNGSTAIGNLAMRMAYTI